ncbi:MAG TPA: hypothetical protein VN703_00865 [Candidatus Sulfopaludibacter sp.]|nr:hypothetical protein [Candidatus Sulfopaludibacter sp.]
MKVVDNSIKKKEKLRVVTMNINLDPKVNLERKDMAIALDSKSIVVTNREELILNKWKEKRIIY